MSKVKLAPSILSADFSCLGQQVETCLQEGCEFVHVDVMDGHFVSNITMGPVIVASLKPILVKYSAVMDVHLMISDPDKFIGDFAEAGADVITVHVESCGNLEETVEMIRLLGVRPGITLNPDTKIDRIKAVIPYVDLVLVMSVNPGFGGQQFIPQSKNKIADLRRILNEIGSKAELEVDGGIKEANVKSVVSAGASVVVAGSAIFSGEKSIQNNIVAIRNAVDG